MLTVDVALLAGLPVAGVTLADALEAALNA